MMKTMLCAAKRYWRELLILSVLIVIAVALPYLEVRSPKLTMIVCLIVACYFFATWASRPERKENECEDHSEES